MTVSKRVAWFLTAFGAWSWIIWPTFLKNIWANDRSWDHGATSFFLVHLVLVVVSLTLGTIIGVLGIRALVRRRSTRGGDGAPAEPATARGLLGIDEGADIDFEPKRLGLTNRPVDL